MNDDMQRTWKDVAVAHWSYYSNICLEGVGKTSVKIPDVQSGIRKGNRHNKSVMLYFLEPVNC